MNDVREELKVVRKKVADALDAAKTSSVSVGAGTTTASHPSQELEEMKQQLQVVKGLASTVKSQGKEIEALRSELTEAKAALQKSVTTGSKLTQQQINQKNTDLAATTTTFLTTKSHGKSSPKTPKKSASTSSLSQATKSPKCSLAINLEDHPKTPSKSPRHGKSSSLPTLKPRFVQLIADAQLKDKALKEFLKTKGASNSLGPCTDYSIKHMKVHDCVDAEGEMRHLVFFHHRVYVPFKIREEAMEFYHKSNPYGCTTALQQHCIWPKLE